MIVQTAIYLGAKSNVTVIGEDTDLLVLLLYHAQKSEFNLYIRSDQKKRRLLIKFLEHLIFLLARNYLEETCSNILFLHAFTGCDSTSKTFNITKSAVFKKLSSNQDFICRFSKYAESFSKDGQPPVIIETAGISTMILLYDGNDKEGLVNLRKKVLLGKVINAKSFVVPENPPLTMPATKFHSFRAYFQVMTWKGNELPNPEDWGWYKKDELLYTVLTDLAPASEYLLKIIRCACKTGYFQCQCKKNGLPPPPSPPLPSPPMFRWLWSMPNNKLL